MRLNERIMKCTVSGCAFNRGEACHARAVMIGGAAHECPRCDTYIEGSAGGMDDMTAMVGVCRDMGCKFNQSMECTSEQIEVDLHSGHPDCITFITEVILQ